MNKLIPCAIAFATIASLSSTALADDVVVVDRREERGVRGGPDTALIGSGVVILGISYGASVVVASTSGHHGDSHLFVPVVGPWLDLADRGRCPVANTACDPETTNKVLLVVDGVFQAIGALSIVGGFLHERREERREHAKPQIHVAPARLGSGYGFAAVGTF